MCNQFLFKSTEASQWRNDSLVTAVGMPGEEREVVGRMKGGKEGEDGSREEGKVGRKEKD